MTRLPSPQPLSVRQPAVAGVFYPADPAQCASEAAALLRSGSDQTKGVRRWSGAIVPHAGWICSGAIAGQAIARLAGIDVTPEAQPTQAAQTAQRGWPDVVVVFGAVHTPIPAESAMLNSAEVWAEPTGPSPVRSDLGARLSEQCGLFAVDDRFHRHEHAVEVELPLIQSAWPGVSILPVEVPLIDEAPEIGRRTAREVASSGLSAVFLASSDLTHYGPGYGFSPAGIGPRGLAWAKDNDRRLLDLVVDLSAERVVAHVRDRANACGGGAIAAMLAACLESGATSAEVLRHANSFETLAAVAPQPPIDAVGYAAVVVG